MIYKYIELQTLPGVVNLWLNRPEKRNAFDHDMILEINHALGIINDIEDNVVLVLRGRGEAFCAGADL
ncbi:MAG TPA: enoyl-CoA hydratase-related protein, partial [Bacteroidales bacterium]